MKTITTYITDDGKEFNDVFQARKHECDLKGHQLEFYNKNMGIQSELNENTYMKFCKNCHQQIIIK